MFQRLIENAKGAVTSAVMKYVARASVAVPFLIALGFALAGATAMLVQRYGATTAYWIMAGALAVMGVIVATFVTVKEHEAEVEEKNAEVEAEIAAAPGISAEAALQAPLAMLGALMSSPGGATSALKIVRLLGRNVPLVLMTGAMGLLFWPNDRRAEDDLGERRNHATKRSDLRATLN